MNASRLGIPTKLAKSKLPVSNTQVVICFFAAKLGRFKSDRLGIDNLFFVLVTALVRLAYDMPIVMVY